jgi:hypothetical protein
VLEIKEIQVCLVLSLRSVEVLVLVQVVMVPQMEAQVALVAADKAALLVEQAAEVPEQLDKVTTAEILALV